MFVSIQFCHDFLAPYDNGVADPDKWRGGDKCAIAVIRQCGTNAVMSWAAGDSYQGGRWRKRRKKQRKPDEVGFHPTACPPEPKWLVDAITTANHAIAYLAARIEAKGGQ